MPVLHVGAFYATQSLLLQRIYVPSANDSEIAQQSILPGESLLPVPYLTFVTGGVAACQTAIGTPTHSGRCAVVNAQTNLVQDTIIADPALYTDPGGNLVIQTDIAIQGDAWTGTQFTRVIAYVSTTTGLAVSVTIQPIAAIAVAPNGQLAVLVPAGTQVGAQIFDAAKLAQLAQLGAGTV